MCRSIYAYMNADFILILEAAATDEFSGIYAWGMGS